MLYVKQFSSTRSNDFDQMCLQQICAEESHESKLIRNAESKMILFKLSPKMTFLEVQ